MGEPFTVRRATLEDIDLLVDLRYAMARELTGEIEIDHSEVPGNPRDYFAAAVPSGDYVCFLAEAGDRVVGIGGMAIYRKPPHPRRPSGVEGYILNMLTMPEWRGKGVASAIVERLLDHARQLGADLVSLNASDEGRRVYEKFGFAENPRYMQLDMKSRQRFAPLARTGEGRG